MPVSQDSGFVPVRLAVIGAGVIGKKHLEKIAAETGAELVAIADPFPAAARAERDVLHLPAYPELSEAQIDRIAERVALVVDTVGAETQQTSTVAG